MDVQTNENLMKASYRYETFKECPTSTMFCFKQAADNGFYYCKEKQLISCYYCCLGISNIVSKFNIKTAHKRFSPNCPIVYDHFLGKEIKVITSEEATTERYVYFLKKLVDTKTNEVAALVKKNKQLVEEHKKELEVVKSEKLCKVCFSNEVNVISFPCKHVILCEVCSEKILDKCPSCKTKINKYFKVFL